MTFLHNLDVLQSYNFVLRAGLVSSHLGAITLPDLSAQAFLECLNQSGIADIRVQQVDASLENIFLALAERV